MLSVPLTGMAEYQKIPDQIHHFHSSSEDSKLNEHSPANTCEL